MNASHLTAPYGTLSLAERAAALAAARAAGRDAVAGPVDPADMQAPKPLEYYAHIVGPLLERGLVSDRSAAGWRLRCLDHRALEDPRVQAFLFGWHEHAIEILTEASGQAERDWEAEVRRLLDQAGD